MVVDGIEGPWVVVGERGEVVGGRGLVAAGVRVVVAGGVGDWEVEIEVVGVCFLVHGRRLVVESVGGWVVVVIEREGGRAEVGG